MPFRDQWRRMTAPAQDYRRAIIFLSITLVPTVIAMVVFPNARYHAQPNAPVQAKSTDPVPVARAEVSTKRRCSSITGPCEILSDSHVGCSDQGVDDKLARFAAQGDDLAFNKLLFATLSTGVCRLWKKGDQVYRDDSTWSGSMCLRPAGETQCFWTVREAVNEP